MIEFDHQLFFWINGWNNPILDYLLTWPTYLGNFEILLLLAFSGMIVFDRKNWEKQVACFAVSLLAVYFMMDVLKIIFSRPRPFDGIGHAVVFQQFFEKPESYSFPSGHAMLAFAAAFLINSLYSPRKFFFLYILALWVGLTRVYLGFHYPSDVLGGALLGILCALFTAIIYKKIQAHAS